MLSVLYFSFNAVAPILILILLGYYARRIGLLSDEAVKTVNKFNFRVSFFCLMFYNLYSVDSPEEISVHLVILVYIILVVLTLAGWIISGIMTKDPARRGVLIMTTYRSNYAIIGLPVATALAGDGAKVLTSILQIPTVIYFNLVSVVVLSIYSKSKSGTQIGGVLKKIATNPLILGLLSGSVVLIIRQYIPVDAEGNLLFSIRGNLPWLYQVIEDLAKMSTPLALIVLGGQLKLSRVKEMKKELVSGVLLRLAAAPAIGFLIVFTAQGIGWITLTKASVAMFAAMLGSPMAVASVVMSQEMGADSELAGQMVVWTSVLGMVSLFIIACLLRGAGLL